MEGRSCKFVANEHIQSNCLFSQNENKIENISIQMPMAQNVLVSDTTEEKKEEKKDTKSNIEIICSACQSDHILLKCNKCNHIIYFCDTCFAFLHKSGQNKSHIPEQILNWKLDENIPSQPCEEINNCPIHRERKLEYFCEPCNTPICSDCLISEHKFHEALKISDKEKNMQEKIEEEVKSYKANQNEILLIKAKIQDKKNEISSLLSNLKQDSIKLIDNLIQALVKRKKN